VGLVSSPHITIITRREHFINHHNYFHRLYANLTRYYIWDVEETSKPFILVRESQVQALLGEINKHLKLTLRITDQQREEVRLHSLTYHLDTRLTITCRV
jgi:hypothetical protein